MAAVSLAFCDFKLHDFTAMSNRCDCDVAIFKVLKTTPIPNKIGLCGIKSGFVCHRSRGSYAMEDSESLSIFQTDKGFFYAIRPLMLFGWGLFGHLKGGHLKMVFRSETCTRHADSF